MCQKRNSTEIPYGNQFDNFAMVDDCIAKELVRLNEKGIPTLGSCCGHNRYKKTIVVLGEDNKTRIEYFSKKVIPRKRRFYITCKEGKNKGYYYIPEISGKENY